jgi:hypothetical protein
MPMSTAPARSCSNHILKFEPLCYIVADKARRSMSSVIVK